MLLKDGIFSKILVLVLIVAFGTIQIVYLQSENKDNLPMQKGNILTSIKFCDLELPNKWKLANLTFSSAYSFKISENGEPINIKKIRDDYVGEDKVKSCISSWKIKGFPEGSDFIVYFYWKHGKGWIEQKVTGNGFLQNIKITEISD